jgi:hypothetical protein
MLDIRSEPVYQGLCTAFTYAYVYRTVNQLRLCVWCDAYSVGVSVIVVVWAAEEKIHYELQMDVSAVIVFDNVTSLQEQGTLAALI